VRWIHSSSSPGEGRPLLLASGGDDGRVALWRWAGGGDGGDEGGLLSSARNRPERAWEAAMMATPGKRRPAKVNAVCQVGGGGNKVALAVADTTRAIKVLSVGGG
jgi:hypothetical protein